MSEATRRLVTVEEQPFNAESPLSALQAPPTPSDLFYVRNHFDVPALDARAWRLSVEGAVDRPFSIDLATLQREPLRKVSVTLECAGNGRSTLNPRVPGTPWAFGAVSTAEFAGAALWPVLERAGLRASAVEALFVGADRGPVEDHPSIAFERSLPLSVCRDPDVLLAWQMNGEPLTPMHGFPVRLVVPKWYAVASVKWLERIRVLETPFAGYFQRTKYVYERDPLVPEGAPVREMRVRSVIATPSPGARVPLGPVTVSGTAWSGFGAIEAVEVSADERNWIPAKLEKPMGPYSAVAWSCVWTPPRAGTYQLASRARDAAGNIQPLSPIWNLHGYGNNGAHRVQVTVE